MDILRERLKKVVDETGLSGNEVAKTLLGMSGRRLNHYILGDRRISMDVLNALCVGLETHPNYLLGWSDSRRPPEENRLAELERAIQELHKRVNRI